MKMAFKRRLTAQLRLLCYQTAFFNTRALTLACLKWVHFSTACINLNSWRFTKKSNLNSPESDPGNQSSDALMISRSSLFNDRKFSSD